MANEKSQHTCPKCESPNLRISAMYPHTSIYGDWVIVYSCKCGTVHSKPATTRESS